MTISTSDLPDLSGRLSRVPPPPDSVPNGEPLRTPLSPWERRLLTRFLEQYHGKSVPSRSYGPPAITALALVLVLLSSIAPQAGAEWLFYLAFGVVAGTLWSDARHAAVTVRFWPRLDEVIDWARVSELLATEE